MTDSSSNREEESPGDETYDRLFSTCNHFPHRVRCTITQTQDLRLLPRGLQEGETICDKYDPEPEPPTLPPPDGCGPLTHLLYRINPTPFPEIIYRAAIADEGHAPDERVTNMDSSLKDALRTGEVSEGHWMRTEDQKRRFFRHFRTKTWFPDQGPRGDGHQCLLNYDPDQEYDVYEYSSDPCFEVADPLQWNRSRESTDGCTWEHFATYRQDPSTKNGWPPIYRRESDTAAYPDEYLSPHLLIHSLLEPPPEANATPLEHMLSIFEYMTYEDDHIGYSVFRTKSQGNDDESVGEPKTHWILIQEFEDEKNWPGSWDPGDLTLQSKEVKHWWYKHGWQHNSVGFYKLCTLPEPVYSDWECDD